MFSYLAAMDLSLFGFEEVTRRSSSAKSRTLVGSAGPLSCRGTFGAFDWSTDSNSDGRRSGTPLTSGLTWDMKGLISD
jgi:hypothetical protein